MPRKPSSVFVLVATPSQVTGQPGGQYTAWRVPLADGQQIEDVVKAHYTAQPVGSRLFVVEDTKVDAFEVGLTLETVEDPRLDDQGGVV